MSNGARQSGPYILGECIGIFGLRSGVSQRLQNRQKIADGHLLAQEVLANLKNRAERHDGGSQLLDHLRMRLLDIIHQRLKLLASEQLGRVLAHDFREMGRDNRR